MIFRQGKTVLMVDTGGAYSVTLIRNFCRAIGVDHVDYLILSHYHADHASGFSGLVGYASGAEQNYPDNLAQHIDFSHCRVFLPIPCHEIDPSSDPASEVDTFFLAKLEELGIEPEYPEELDTLVISESLKVTFFNAGRQALNETREIHRQKSTSALDINDCSMCCLVQHGNATFFLTGDLTVNGEERLARKYQLVRRMELTPGALNPLPVSGSVPAGTLLTWDADFVPGPFDGVGPLASAENFYRKIFHPDVYKVGHHAFNAAGRATSDAYYAMLKPKAAFVATTYERDDAPAGKGHLETSASLLACPVYSAGLDDLKFVSDGIEPACVYGSMDWTGASRKLLHPGRHLHLYPALVGATGNHALWARIRFQEPQRPFSMCVHVSTLAGPAVESALLEFSCVLEPGGFVSRDASRARIISATAGFSGVFGMIHEGGGLVYLTVRKDDGVVWSATILSANFLESAVLASPVYKLSYSQATINGLAQPKWYKAAA